MTDEKKTPEEEQSVELLMDAQAARMMLAFLRVGIEVFGSPGEITGPRKVSITMDSNIIVAATGMLLGINKVIETAALIKRDPGRVESEVVGAVKTGMDVCNVLIEFIDSQPDNIQSEFDFGSGSDESPLN